MLPIRMWQYLEGKLDATTVALTLLALVMMEHLTGLSLRIT
jgi:hypothetical protein